MKKENKSKIFSMVMGLMLAINIVALIAMPIGADEFKTQANTEIGVLDPGATIEIGDTFTTTIYLDPGTETTITAWKIYEMLFNDTATGILNATKVTFSGYWRNIGMGTDPGTTNNDTGNITDIQSFNGAGTGTNYTACNITWLATGCGRITIALSDTKVEKTGPADVDHAEKNITFNVYPQQPASLNAVAYNNTAINLTFTRGTGDDNVTLCGKAGSYPANPSDSVLYNGTNHTYNHSGLLNCTKYFYCAWGWNETGGIHSIYYRQASATTQCDTNFTFTGITPADNARTTNCTYSVALNLTISNNGGHSCRWYINTTDGDSWTGTNLLNTTTPTRTMTGLNHNTTYWWNVTAIAGTDTGYSNQSFTTGWGGGTRPTATNPTPANGASSISINPATFSVDIADAEGDPVGNVSFYWSNGTRIGKDTSVTVPGTASVSGPAYTLNYGTTYTWYATVDDGCTNATSASFTFTTDTRSMAITKEWVAHAGNSTIQAWINVTNNGQANMPTITINDTLDTNVEFNTSSPVATHSGADFVSWENASLNVSKSYSIMLWLNVTNFRLANNTAINNGANVTEGNVTFTATAPSALRYRYEVTKTANMTTLKWNTTAVNYTINVTNTGDFTLHNVTINESIPRNMTFRACHGGTANATNESFAMGDLAPGATVTLYVEFNTSYKTASKMLVNGTQVYNNITAISNETQEITKSHYLFVGARTSLIRIRYDSYLTDVQDIGETVINILGVLLIIGSILLIVYVVNKYNLFGGGE